METIHIREVAPAELEELRAIAIRTFLETFEASNTAENMKLYLAEGFSMETLIQEYNNPASSFYFATHNNKPVGYLKLNYGPAQKELKDDKALEIERIYVLQEYQGKRVGKMLFNKAISLAKESNAGYVWLGVWEENHKAINFYTKNGFRAFGKHTFWLGNDEQTDIMMRLDLDGSQ